jgi:hypothetical protein
MICTPEITEGATEAIGIWNLSPESAAGGFTVIANHMSHIAQLP